MVACKQRKQKNGVYVGGFSLRLSHIIYADIHPHKSNSNVYYLMSLKSKDGNTTNLLFTLTEEEVYMLLNAINNT